MKRQHFILFTFSLLLGITGCSNDDSMNKSEGTAGIAVALTDAPGDYDQVWVEVEDIMIKSEEGDNDEEGWESLGVSDSGPFDLLTLTGGNTQLLADTEVPAGYLRQMRMILGDNNTIVVDGVSYTLHTPSAQQSGLKLQVNQELEAGIEYNFVLDFDVDESVVKAGQSGNYNLHPVLRLSAEATTGSVTGSVHPTNQSVEVVAENGTVRVSAYTNDAGVFKLHGLPEGTYKIIVTPDEDSGFFPAEVDNVEVDLEEVTDLGVIYLEE